MKQIICRLSSAQNRSSKFKYKNLHVYTNYKIIICNKKNNYYLLPLFLVIITTKFVCVLQDYKYRCSSAKKFNQQQTAAEDIRCVNQLNIEAEAAIRKKSNKIDKTLIQFKHLENFAVENDNNIPLGIFVLIGCCSSFHDWIVSIYFIVLLLLCIKL